jgi:uncharacterized integral membrane protein
MAISWEIPLVAWLIAAPCVAFLVVYRRARREFTMNGIVLVIASSILIMLGISITTSFQAFFLMGAFLFLTGVLSLQLGLTRHPSRFNWMPAISPPVILGLLCLVNILYPPETPTVSFLFLGGMFCSGIIPIYWWNEKKKAISLRFRSTSYREAAYTLVHIAEIAAILVFGFAVISLQFVFGEFENPMLSILVVCLVIGFVITIVLAKVIQGWRKRKKEQGVKVEIDDD